MRFFMGQNESLPMSFYLEVKHIGYLEYLEIKSIGYL